MEAEKSRGETPGMGQALFCMLGGGCGCGMGFMGGLGGLQALPRALTFTSCLCRAPGICQAPERELPGCRRVSALLEGAGCCCQPGWAPLPSIQSLLQLRTAFQGSWRTHQHPRARASPAQAEPMPAWI